MDEYYLYVSSDGSHSYFENVSGGVFRTNFTKANYVLDGEWEYALLELSFVPNSNN